MTVWATPAPRGIGERGHQCAVPQPWQEADVALACEWGRYAPGQCASAFPLREERGRPKRPTRPHGSIRRGCSWKPGGSPVQFRVRRRPCTAPSVPSPPQHRSSCRLCSGRRSRQASHAPGVGCDAESWTPLSCNKGLTQLSRCRQTLSGSPRRCARGSRVEALEWMWSQPRMRPACATSSVAPVHPLTSLCSQRRQARGAQPCVVRR